MVAQNLIDTVSALPVGEQFELMELLRRRLTPTAVDETTFRSLVEQWRNERPRGVDLDRMTDTPAYRAIVGMGQPAVPLILAELAARLDHWFPALNRITGEDPVPPEAAGKMKQMAAAWLRWGRERGYVGDVD